MSAERHSPTSRTAAPKNDAGAEAAGAVAALGSPESQGQFLGTLNSVADAISSKAGLSECLDVVIDGVKWVADTDKAILVLAGVDGELNVRNALVRGRRDRLEQAWWEERLRELGALVFETRKPAMESSGDGTTIVCMPVLVRGDPIGLLAAINDQGRPFTAEQVESLAVLSAFAASAVENARLHRQNRHLLLASERERIAGEMHDGPVQSLFMLSLGLEACKKQMKQNPSMAEVRLEAMQEHLNSCMTELRRLIYDLRPEKLTELGLEGAIDYWLSEVTVDNSVLTEVAVPAELPLTPSQEACLYWVAKEAVTNAMKHGAPSRVNVRVWASEDGVVLEVADDGDGFDRREHDGAGRGMGIRSITERVHKEGGLLVIDSFPGEGTKVRADLPIERPR
jgi:signal transduction histidine kinase